MSNSDLLQQQTNDALTAFVEAFAQAVAQAPADALAAFAAAQAFVQAAAFPAYINASIAPVAQAPAAAFAAAQAANAYTAGNPPQCLACGKNAAAAAAFAACLQQLCKAQASDFFLPPNRFPRLDADVAVVATPTATAQQSPLAAGEAGKQVLSDAAVLSGGSALGTPPTSAPTYYLLQAIKAHSDRITALERAGAGANPPPPPTAA